MSNRETRRPRAALTARTADRYALYEQSVQATEAEIAFIDRIYKQEHGRPALRLREDFCGSAILCADWVRSRRERTAVGLDLDAPTLAYSREKHIAKLGEAASRVELLERNVLSPLAPQDDVIVAFNFSYCVFKTRSDLVGYFAAARAGLAPGGVFLLDVYGGPDAQTELTEKKAVKGFTYVWEQAALDAISNCAWRYIHFRFPDGTQLRRAFSYDWRIWSLPEMRDALAEAGFSRVEVFWEGSDQKGRGNGVFRKVAKAVNEQAWIAYVAAWAS